MSACQELQSTGAVKNIPYEDAVDKKVCPFCFKPIRGSVQGRRIFCNDFCRFAFYSNISKNGERTCKQCGAVLDDKHKFFCCNEHKKLYQEEHGGKKKRSPSHIYRTTVLNDSEKLSIRRCHDCGKPTTDYRCYKCLMKFRKKHHVPIHLDGTPIEDD